MGHWNDLHVNTHEFPFRIDPDYDAPWRQPAELLPAWARCDTCLYWCGLYRHKSNYPQYNSHSRP